MEEDSCDSVEVGPLETVVVSGLLPTMVNGVDDVAMDNVHRIQQPVDETKPYLIVSEQPQSRGFRFRYKCEGPSHGGLQGVNSQKSKKTFPTVQIQNYQGPARIIVTLVTDEVVPKIHAHELVGKNCQNGICVVELKANEPRPEHKFTNLGIMHVTKKNVKNILQQRILESKRLDQLIRLGNVNMTDEVKFTDEDIKKAKDEANKEAKSMQLSVVKLCFQAYILDHEQRFNILLPPVLSDPIFDSKSPGAAALKICRMDKYGGCCTGNEEVFLLCEKVQKDDISVRFVETNESGKVVWQGYGDFGPSDVHRQYAIVFKTPPYRDTSIQKAVTVQIQLKRKTDDELSDPKSFTYYPEDSDKEGISTKRRKRLPGMGPGRDSTGDGQHGDGPGYGYGNNDRNSHQYGEGHGFPGNDFTFNNQSGQHFQQLQTATLEKDPTMVIPKNFEQQQQEHNLNGKLQSHAGQQVDNTGDLEIDCEPFKDDKIDREGTTHSKQKNQTSKTDSVDDGFFSQEILSIQDEGKISKDKRKTSQQQQCSPQQETEKTRSKTSSIMKANESAIIRVVERITEGLRNYAVSGDICTLLMVHRHLALMTDVNGDLPLHLAIINNQEVVVQQLLTVMSTLPDKERKVNAYNSLHQTPLHLAVLTQQTSVIDLLLKYGANPALVDRYGNTPAHLATKAGDFHCITALTKYLRPGVTQEKPFPELDIFNYEGVTPIHLAVLSGDLNTLMTVCTRKAFVDPQDGKSGRTPLHYAVEADDLSLTGYLLLEAGAEPNSTTFDNNTPLHIACGRGLVGMVALLMNSGADPNMENDENPSDVESEDENEDEQSDKKQTMPSRGIRPGDLVKNNTKILRILKGEQYGSLQDLKNPPSPSYISNLKSISESGFDSVFGELWPLDHTTRVKLSKLLDPECKGSDWEDLADALYVDNDVKSVLKQAASPTRAVLEHYEKSFGTIEKLEEALQLINRHDAVQIVKSCLSKYESQFLFNNPSKHKTISSQFDSGYRE